MYRRRVESLEQHQQPQRLGMKLYQDEAEAGCSCCWRYPSFASPLRHEDQRFRSSHWSIRRNNTALVAVVRLANRVVDMLHAGLYNNQFAVHKRLDILYSDTRHQLHEKLLARLQRRLHGRSLGVQSYFVQSRRC